MKSVQLFRWLVLCVFLGSVYSAQAYGPPIKAFHRSDFRGEQIYIHADWSVNNSRDRWNNAINSLIIPRGYEAHLFERKGFQGGYLVVRGEWSSQQDRYWFNRISSIRLVPVSNHRYRRGGGRDYGRDHRDYRRSDSHVCGPACGTNCTYVPAPTITVFEHHSYGGASLTITGEWSVNYSDDFWNDRISSVYVPRGYAVILYEDAHFRGRSVVLEHSWNPYSSGDFWNDRISSIRVIRI